jgi:N-methylhydantoinase A
VTAESTITDLPLRMPVIDIHTVGAGGGSIAFVDAGGALQVGPRSAGALPGPACYGRGGLEPTVTDANLILGRLDPAGFLNGGGQVQLDVAAARHALGALGAKLRLSAEAAALGVVQVANATMEQALRKVSVEQGYDPRAFTLLPFGGAGPLHACDLADALGIRRILCPPMPGVLSAYGMLVADVVSDTSQAVLSTVSLLIRDWRPLQATCTELAARAKVALGAERVDDARLTAALDLRYQGQSYELTVPLTLPVDPAGLRAAVDAFHQTHEQRYGYAMTEETMEAVTVRVRASAPGAELRLPAQPLATADPSPARLADRSVWFGSRRPRRTAGFQRDRLAPGNQLSGPAIVLQYDSTVLVAPGWQAWVDPIGNLWLTR